MRVPIELLLCIDGVFQLPLLTVDQLVFDYSRSHLSVGVQNSLVVSDCRLLSIYELISTLRVLLHLTGLQHLILRLISGCMLNSII